MATENPLLSVVIVTYNHEKYIASSIESVLRQRVNFNYEVLICDDASTDGTGAILSSFKNNNPDHIDILVNGTNVGPWKSAAKVYEKCQGKYITWLDGDDSWSNDDKLQHQIDFLETNADYIGCFHDAEIVTHSNDSDQQNETTQLLVDCERYSQFNEYRSDFYPWHLLQRNIIPTASLVFRDNLRTPLFDDPPDTSLSLNWLLHLRIIKGSKFKYFDESWSIYNDHPQGASKTHGLNEFKHANVSILRSLIKDEYYWEFKKAIYQSMANEYLHIMLNPSTIRESKTAYYKASINYLVSCFKTVIHLMRYYRESK